MYSQIDEKIYLYFLAVIPIIAILFLINLYWKRKKQREFGDVELVKKLSPEKSVFKPVLKITVLLLALASLIIVLANTKIGTKMDNVKREGIDVRRRHISQAIRQNQTNRFANH